jgi:hypothetical protein
MMSEMALKIAATLCLFAGLPTMPARQAPEVLSTRAATKPGGTSAAANRQHSGLGAKAGTVNPA